MNTHVSTAVVDLFTILFWLIGSVPADVTDKP